MKHFSLIVLSFFFTGCVITSPNDNIPPSEKPLEEENRNDQLSAEQIDVLVRPVLESDPETTARNANHFEMVSVEPGTCENCLITIYQYRIVDPENPDSLEIGYVEISLQNENIMDLDWEYILPDPYPQG